MNKILLIVSSFLITFHLFAQPSNDNCVNAINLTDLDGWCSTGGAYSNVASTSEGLTPGCWTTNSNNNVWFKFTAVNIAVNIEVNGVSLNRPQIALITSSCGAGTTIIDQCNQAGSGSSSVSVYSGNLTIGQEYHIVVDGVNNNIGSFDVCINNFNPPSTPGVDCIDAAQLCSKDAVTNASMSGYGIREAFGTCMDTGIPSPPTSETNSVWYTFTAANNGTLEFTLDPLIDGDDLDWALFELTSGSDCSSKSIISCNTRSCIYNGGQTGMSSLVSTSNNKDFGCPGAVTQAFNPQETLVSGRTYALLIENATSGTPSVNNGFTLSFGGSIEFIGPVADVTLPTGPFCTNIAYTFTDNSTGAPINWEWDFGSDASLTSYTGQTPPAITYSSAGTKTIVLTVDNGTCSDVYISQITVTDCTPSCNLSAIGASDTTITKNCGTNLYDFTLTANFTNSPGTGTIQLLDGATVLADDAYSGTSHTFNVSGQTIPTSGNTRVLTVVFSDDISCTVDFNFVEPVCISCPVDVTFTTTDASCSGVSDGSINGSSPDMAQLAFAWTGPNGFTSTSNSPTGIEAGTYDVTVTRTIPSSPGGTVTQTVFTEDFEDGGIGWTIDNSSGPNLLVVNPDYLGGSCVTGLGTFNVPDVPNQPGVITGSPTSNYLHIIATTTSGITCGAGSVNFIPDNANYDGATSNQSATLNTPFSTVGLNNINIDYYWICDGSDVDDYGTIEYSLDGGTLWTQIGGNIGGQTNWTLSTNNVPALDNQANILLRITWQNDASSSTDPPIAIDEIIVTGESTGLATPGCTSTSTDQVIIGAGSTEDASFTMTQTCDGGTVTVGSVVTLGGSYAFASSPSDGAVIDAATGAVTGGTFGTTYTVAYTTSGTCPNTSTQNVTPLPLDDASFSYIIMECTSASPTVTGLAGGSFDFTGSNPLDGAQVNATTGEITNGIVGTTYNITYTTINCVNTNDVSVTLLDAISFDTITSPVTCIPLTDGTAEVFNVQGANNSTYNYTWSSGENTVLITDKSSGNYTVTVSDLNALDCSTSEVVTIDPATVNCPEPDLYVPSAFSPDGNGENDILYVRGTAIEALEFYVFDRWGKKVFESTDLNIGWDGTYKGNTVDDGVYMYRVKAIFSDGTEQELTGDVTILR